MTHYRSSSSSTSRNSSALNSRRLFLHGAGATVFLTGFELSGCAVFSSFSHSDPELDERAAASATREAIDELKRLCAEKKDEKISVCFIGVTGASNAGALSETTRERLEGCSEFRCIGKAATQKALKESGVRPNNVFIPKEREKFVESLGEKVDYLLAGYVEDATIEGDDGREIKKRVYRLSLVESSTNRKEEFTADL